ncbi:IclR family transcriptional regulator [Falsiroseomonas oryzae]|uniref:IclR family transcriptional regulator n=1 Tax=Falsiroseomonas oryzae TaxID=2766473 RepID=UPI0022EAEB74|nr:IclR family transcriptional regulator [Roseomonas sp. MO-31]
MEDMLKAKAQADEPAWFVSSVEKAFRILRAFELGGRSLSLTEIAELTGLDKSAAQRFTYTLAALGYLHKDSKVRRYTISPKVMSLGMIYLRTDPIVARARHQLYELNKSLDATVNMTVLDDTDIIYVVRYPGRRTVTVDVVLGMRRPAFCSASGRAILSTLPDEQVATLLQRSKLVAYTQYTKTSPDAIMAEIRKARAEGFALTEQETAIGDISLAAPVRNPDGRATAAINISVSVADWTGAELALRLGPTVVEAARAISGTSEFRPMPPA